MALVTLLSKRRSILKLFRYGRRSLCEISSLKERVELVLNDESYKQDVQALANLVLKCGAHNLVEQGKLLHSTIHKLWHHHPERLLLNCLVEMYGKLGNADMANSVFATIWKPNVFSWAIVIAANASNGHYTTALALFKRMDLDGVKPNCVTYVNVISACAHNLLECKKLHSRIIADGYESNTVVMTALVTMLGKCGDIRSAALVFERMYKKDVVTWNALITAHAQLELCEECLALYERMEIDAHVRPDDVTYVSVIDACAGLRNLECGRRVHERIAKYGLECDDLLSALIDMYGKCGSCAESKKAFDRMRRPGTSAWNALISAFAHTSTCTALKLVHSMDLEGVKANDITFINLLCGLSGTGSLWAGRSLHTRIVQCGLDTDVMVGTAVVTMYGKCGVAEEARAVFDKMLVKNVVCFNAMIGSYAELCYVKQALELYWTMDQVGLTPNSVTLLSILFACSHGGMLNEGLSNFTWMGADRGIVPELDHYRCVVDLLARAGWLPEAEELIEAKFSLADDLMSRLSLLSACISQEDGFRGRRSLDRIVMLKAQTL